MNDLNEFQPQWMSPPGETIRDILENRKQTVKWLAEQLDCSNEYLERIIVGKESITSELALGLKEALGASPDFWMRRDSIYQTALQEVIRRQSQWISQVPTKQMIEFGWIKPAMATDIQSIIFQFFGIEDAESWQKKYQPVIQNYAFRTSLSFESTPVGVSVWLRKAEMEAEKINCKPWNPKNFHESLAEIRKLTKQKDPQVFIPRLQTICSESGVAVVVVRSVKGCNASGATRFVSETKAIIVMSVRHLTDDHFWFTFFHEAAHLLLHKDDKFTLDFNNSPLDSEIPKHEIEANEFSANLLIPIQDRELLKSVRHNYKDVIKLASKLGVSPGIVVGQMQHGNLIQKNQLNSSKRRYLWD
ncbi:MAG: hypothetical protein RLZZ156_2689, partial [Deinococcota bacterium]